MAKKPTCWSYTVVMDRAPPPQLPHKLGASPGDRAQSSLQTEGPEPLLSACPPRPGAQTFCADSHGLHLCCLPQGCCPCGQSTPQLPGPQPDSLQGPRAPTRHTPFSRPLGPRPITPDLGIQAPRRDGQASSSQGPHLGLVFHSAWSGRPGAQFVLVPCTQTLGLPVSPRVRLGWYLLIFSQASVLGPRPRCLVPHMCSAPSKHTRELFCPLASRAPKLSRWRPCSHVAHGYI